MTGEAASPVNTNHRGIRSLTPFISSLYLSAFQGPGRKANDSLDMMFDMTAYGEYESFSSSQLGQSQPCEEEEDDQDDGGFLHFETLCL